MPFREIVSIYTITYNAWDRVSEIFTKIILCQFDMYKND